MCPNIRCDKVKSFCVGTKQGLMHFINKTFTLQNTGNIINESGEVTCLAMVLFPAQQRNGPLCSPSK